MKKKVKISRWRRTGYNSSHITRSPHPTGPASLHDPCASKLCSARVCIMRGSRTAGGRPVSSRRAARSTEPPIARNCGVRRHLHPCVSEQQRPPALQGAPGLPIRAPRLAVPTAQARMTRARGLHATRSSIRKEHHMSSLPERRIAHRFFLFRWHRAHTCHTLNVRTATSTDRWPGSQARMTCTRPIMGTWA